MLHVPGLNTRVVPGEALLIAAWIFAPSDTVTVGPEVVQVLGVGVSGGGDVDFDVDWVAASSCSTASVDCSVAVACDSDAPTVGAAADCTSATSTAGTAAALFPAVAAEETEGGQGYTRH